MPHGYSRRELVTFLRAIAQAADNGELGVEHAKMMVNGDLMREAATMLEGTAQPPRMDRTTMTPAQLGAIFEAVGGSRKAFSIIQDGSTLFVNTGKDNFALNAGGETIKRPTPRWVTGDDT